MNNSVHRGTWSWSVISLVTAWLILVVGWLLAIFLLPEVREYPAIVAAVFASFSAVIAALIAYDGATLKARQDMAIHEAEKRSHRINVLLKAIHMAEGLAERSLAPMMGPLWFSAIQDGEDIPGTIPSETLRVARPKQLDELWNELALFPRPVIDEIRRLTTALDAAEQYLSEVDEVPDGSRSSLSRLYGEVLDCARLIARFLEHEISTELPNLPQGFDRNIALYGEQD